jgi:hypothetical protein
VDDIFIIFEKETIRILSTDNTNKALINIKIDCNKINEYYCKKPFEICVKREYLEKIFNTIEKQHNKIIFYSNDNYLSTLYINLLNDELGIHDNYVIDLSIKSVKNEDLNMEHIIKDNYLIQFKMQSKLFKKFINDSSNNSRLLTIEKIGNNSLQFKMTINNKVTFTRTFCSDEKFQLKSKVKTDEYFSVNIELDMIKPFSNMNISNLINIYLDNNKKAIFEADINNKLCIVTIYNDCLNLVRIED